MNSISCHVGKRIKRYRKSRGYTIDQFSAMIHKSKATLSKYENGAITVDIETLYLIAQALDVDIRHFLDFPAQQSRKSGIAPQNMYFDRPQAYMYYYDGRVRKVVRSLLRFFADPGSDAVEVTLYNALESFSEPEQCKHLFFGEMRSYDTITHMVLTNQMNAAEKMYLCVLNPMQQRAPAVGLVSGIGSSPFFAPIAVKALLSKEPLEESDRLLSEIKLNREDYHLVRYYNMLVVNRPIEPFL